MGYLRRKPRRSRAATIRRPETLARATEGSWVPAAEPELWRNWRHVRFGTHDRRARLDQPLGVFHAIGILKRAGALADDPLRRASEALRWFNRHLPAPKRIAADAVFWFRGDAHQCLARVWALIHVLREYEWDVRMMYCDDPGRIVYADELQVAAIRYRDRSVGQVPLTGQ